MKGNVAANDRSTWLIAAAFLVLGVPLEAALVWAVYQLGAWAVPLFGGSALAALLFRPRSSETLQPRVNWESISANLRGGPPRPHFEDVWIPPPPAVPRDLLHATLRSTLPSPAFEAVPTMEQFQAVAEQVTTRPPPSIN